MRHLVSLGIISSLFISHLAFASNGIVSVKSAHSVAETADRLEAVLHKKGMTVFIRINHAEGAKKVNAHLRPTEVVIFGNPKVGTPLMKCSQSTAIDLPQKALISEDANGQVWFSYNDPAYLKARHNITGCDKVLAKVSHALSNFSKAATAK